MGDAENSDSVLIIPDVHQNYEFLEMIFQRENAADFSKIVFLGDFLDAKDPKYATPESLKRTLLLLEEIVRRNPEKVDILIGNHDFVYYHLSLTRGNSLATSALVDYCGIPDIEKLSILRHFGEAMFRNRLKLVSFEHGYLLSHAGVDQLYWANDLNVEQNVRALNASLSVIVDENNNLKQLFQAGAARGGFLEKGGPLWLDWFLEFEDNLEVPQIVGHTVSTDWRKVGESYCLDARQQVYAILSSSGVEVRNASN